MTITHKLAFLAAMPLLLLLMVSAAAFTTYRGQAQARETSRIAAQLETQVFSLGLLSYDYLNNREERARAQWRQIHASLGRALDAAEGELLARSALAQLRADHSNLAAVFSQLTAPRAATLPLGAERESWLVARLLLYTQSAFTDAVRLREAAERRLAQEQAFFFSFAIALLALLGTATAIVAWRIAAGIRASLYRLHRAAEAIAAGNLDYRANTLPRDEHGELAQALNTMARDLKALQQQIIQSEKLSALGTLAAGVAHELNNPLMGVMGYVGRAQVETREPGTREVLARAWRELERMRDLLKNMLGFARPVDETLSEVSIPEVLDHALDLMRADFKNKGIEVTSHLPSALPTVAVKEGALQQVFVNLLLNARDAVEGRPERRIAVTAKVTDGEVAISISDTGPGISPHIAGRIFDPFFTTKPPGKGTGLGLSISRTTIEDLGGSLRHEIRMGEGATFTITLPRHARR